MGFNFRLAQILRLRQAEENLEKNILQNKIADLDVAEKKLNSSRQESGKFAEKKQELEQAGQPAPTFLQLHSWQRKLADKIVDDQVQVAAADAAVQRQQGRFYNSRQKRQLLENLRGRRAEEYFGREEHRQQVVLDELVVQRLRQSGY